MSDISANDFTKLHSIKHNINKNYHDCQIGTSCKLKPHPKKLLYKTQEPYIKLMSDELSIKQPKRFSNSSFLYGGRSSLYDVNRSPALSIFSLYSNFSLSSYSSKSSYEAKQIEPRFQFKNTISPLSGKKKLHKPKFLKKGDKNLPHLVQIIKEQAKVSLKSKYRLMDTILGSGSGGTVYLVERKSDQKILAAKVFKRRGDQEDKLKYWERITNEIYIGSITHNDNCVKVFDIVNLHSCIVQIMEYCPKDLFSIIEFQQLEPSQINNCFAQLIYGVAYLHGYGIAHRDLKLENICIGEDDRVKIVDYGCSKIFKAGMDSFLINSDGLYGSDYYYSPESFSLDPKDVTKMDVWALGIIYLAMLTKRFPWKSSHCTDKDYTGFLVDREGFLKHLGVYEEVVSLLVHILEPDPKLRISVRDILEHPGFVYLDNSSLVYSSSTISIA